MNLHQELNRISASAPQSKIENHTPRRERRKQAREAAKMAKVNAK